MKSKETGDRRLRILLLHNIVAPYRLPLFQDINKKYELCVFFGMAKTQDRLWQTSGLKGYDFQYLVLPHIKMGPLVVNYSLPWEILRRRYDIYMFAENPENMFSVFSPLFAAKLFRKPVIIWSEFIETQYSRSRSSKLVKKILLVYRKFLYCQANAIVGYSLMAADFLMRNGVSKRKIFVGPQVMPAELIEDWAGSKDDTDFKDRKVVLYLGYLNKGKGVDVLINACQSLNHRDVILVIAGTGEEADRLKMLAKGNDNIRFVGYVDGQEKSKYYSLADIFVLPSFHDAWGLVVNEAMYFGLPIITTTAVASSEIIRDNGVVIPPGDEEALRNALRRLLEDDALRKEMGRKSRMLIKEYDVYQGVKPFVEAMEYVSRRGS